jgi:HEAT repeat protein
MIVKRILVPTRIRIALVAIFFYVALTASTSGQVPSQSDVLAQMRNGTPQEVETAISSLDGELLKQDEVVGQLVLLLNDDRTVKDHGLIGRETVRDRAWFKLREAETTAVVSIIRRIPELKSDRARGEAFEVISRIGARDAAAYSQILGYCKDEDVYVRSRAIRALSAVGDDSITTVNQFGEFLNDSNPSVRWAVLDALSERKDRIDSLIPAIVKLLDDDSDVHIAVSNHFAIPEKLQGHAARLLVRLGPAAAEALPKLRQLMDPQYDTNVRIWAAAATCTISDTPPQDALELLGQLMLSEFENEDADNHATQAIEELGPLAAPLLDDMERAKKHRSPSIRWGVAHAYFTVEPQSAVRRVLPMMDDEDELVVESVIEALSAHGISDPAVIDAYIRVLDKRDDDFEQPAYHAVEALAKLGPAAQKAIPALRRLHGAPEISDWLREDVGRAIEAINMADIGKPDD